MSDETPSDAVRLRAVELALGGVIAFVSRGILERAEANMAAMEARAVGDERAAAKLAGAYFDQALLWHLEGDDDAGRLNPDVPPDPEEVEAFEFEVERLIRIEAPEQAGPDDLDRLADAIVAVPSNIVAIGNMNMRERLAEAIRARAAEARGR